MRLFFSLSHEIKFACFASTFSTILTAGPINYTALDVFVNVCCVSSVLVCFYGLVSLLVKWTVPFFAVLFSAELLASNSLMQQQF